MRPYRELPGAVWHENGQVVHNPEDAPTLIRPDFQGLPLEHYTVCCRAGQPTSESVEMNLLHFYKWPMARGLTASEINRRRLPVEDRKETLFVPHIFNYHCPYQCAFCVQSREDKPPAVFKDARSVVDDIEALTNEYDSEYIHYWSDCARFNNLTEELVDLLYRAGCRKLLFGLDTASERVLKLIDKRLDLQQARLPASDAPYVDL